MLTLVKASTESNELTDRAIPIWLYFLVGCAAAILVALYLYPSTGYFLYDDARMILLNRPAEVGDLARAFFELRDNFYRPVFEVAIGLESLIWLNNPLGYHLVNVVLHLLTSASVYVLASLLLSRPAALIAAAFFLANVAHAEPVIWISGLHSEIPALFATISLTFYVLADRGKSLNRTVYVASLATWVLALLAKESAYTVPLVIAAYHVVFSRREKHVLAVRLLPFLPMMALYAWLRLSQGTGYALETLDIGPLSLMKNAFGYVIGGFVPLPDDYRYFSSLALWRSAPLLPVMMLVLGGLSLALLVRTGIVSALKREQAVLFGFLWLLLTLPPILPIYAERELYLPSIGAAIAVGAVFGSCLRLSHSRSREVMVGSALALLLAANLLGLAERSYWWKRAGDLSHDVTYAVVDKVGAMNPGARLVLLGVPDRFHGTHLQGQHFPWTLQLASGGAIQVESVLIGSYLWPAPENANRGLPQDAVNNPAAAIIDLRSVRRADGTVLLPDP